VKRSNTGSCLICREQRGWCYPLPFPP